MCFTSITMKYIIFLFFILGIFFFVHEIAFGANLQVDVEIDGLTGNPVGGLASYMPNLTSGTMIQVQSFDGTPFTGISVCSSFQTVATWDSHDFRGYLSQSPTCGNFADGDYYITFSNPDGHTYYAVYSVVGGLITVQDINVSTRIIEIIPQGGTVATGTQAVGFLAFLNANDWNGGPAHYDFQLTRVGNPIAGSGDNLWLFEQEIDDSGYIDFSTTTNLSVGEYTIQVRMYYSPICILGFCSFYDQLASSTIFIAGSQGGFSDLYNDITGTIADLLASTTLAIGNVCSPLSTQFSAVACITAMIIPPADVLAGDFNSLRTLPPWGYGFRFYDILSGNATTTTSTMPIISYTFSSTSRILANETFEFDVLSTLEEGSLIQETVSDREEAKNLWEIINPLIAFLTFVAVGGLIIRDILRLRT